MKFRTRIRLLSAALGFRRPAVKATAFAGAQYNRLTLDWWASLQSADREIRSSLRTLRARSRQLVRDNPHATAFVNLVKNNVIGPTGIGLQSRITKGDGLGLRKTTNDAIEAGWDEWGEPGICTVDGKLSWGEVQDLYIGTMAVDGEVLLRVREGANNAFGFALQFLDADQLDETFNRPPGNGLTEIRMGVEIDPDSRPLAYHLFDGHPADLTTRLKDRIRIPAGEIIHDFITLRPGQTRGLPWMTPVLFRLNMLDAYEENEIIASRASSAKPVYFSVHPEFADVYSDIEKPTEPLQWEVEPASATQLPAGLIPHQMDPTHPTTAFGPFQKSCLRAIAAGLGVSYNALANDIEAVNYSSIRAGIQQERDLWRKLQARTTCRLHYPVFRRWLKWAATTGAVQLPSLDVRRWTAPAWQPRGFQWVDIEAEQRSKEAELKLGINTRTMMCAELGRDYEDVVIALAEEQEIADRYGVDVSGSSPSGQAQVQQPEPPRQEPDPSLAAIAESTRETTAAVKWIAGREQPAPVINVTTPPVTVTIEPSPVTLTVEAPPKGGEKKTVTYIKGAKGEHLGATIVEE